MFYFSLLAFVLKNKNILIEVLQEKGFNNKGKSLEKHQ